MSGNSENLRRTPLYDLHLASGARMVGFGGWEMPVSYEGQVAEHHAVRHAAGIFDTSHMGQVRLRGERVWDFLAVLLPANMRCLAAGQARYSPMCTPEGGVVDDLIVSRLENGDAFIVVNAATAEKDVQWITRQLRELGFNDVELADESNRWAMLAFQGPQSLEMLEGLLPGTAWSRTKAFTVYECEVEGALNIVSRTGYTGENGVEILCPPAQAPGWWERLVKAGATPAGLGARDSLRLEMGMALYGQDLSEEISPVEAGLGWTVHLKRDDAFVGRPVLERQKAEGPSRTRVGLKLDSRRPLRPDDRVLMNEQEIGKLTSGGFSPTLGAGIGLALVDRRAAEGQSELTIESRGKQMRATVVDPPFVSVKSKPVK